MKAPEIWLILLGLCAVSSSSLWGQKIEKTLRIEQSYSPRNDIRSIQFDREGTMWIGTADGILKKEKEGTFEWNESLGSCYVKEVKVDGNNQLWVSLWPGGLRHSQDQGQSWAPIAEFGTMPVMSVICEKHVPRYVATWGAGIYKHISKWTKLGEEKTYEKGVNAILKTSNGDLWIASYLGLVRYDESVDTACIYTTHNSPLPSNNIYKLAADNQKNVWAGTDCGLINITQKQLYTTINSPLPGLSILSLYCPADKHGIWIGTNKGLAFFNGEKWSIRTTGNSGIIGEKVQCIIEREGKIYVGTDKGINIISYP